MHQTFLSITTVRTMAQVNTVTFVLILLVISFVFLSGLFWCFCCGTCVGRSLLGQTPFRHWVRDNRGYRGLDPQQYSDEEEQWALEDWDEPLVDDDDDDDDDRL